jgi:membrane-associated phospholipid phosphatase
MARRVDGAIDALSTAVTWPGYPPQNAVLPPAVALFVAWLRGWRTGLFQLAAWGVMPIGMLIKRVVRRPRPLKAMLPTDAHRASGASFPSTHVAMYTAYYGFTGWAIGRRAGWSRVAAMVPLTLIAVIGPSRIREGKHHRSDVVAGYVLGASWLALLIALARRTEKVEAEKAEAEEPAAVEVDGVRTTSASGEDPELAALVAV